MSSEIISILSDGDKPLCPQSTNSPVNEAHQLHTRMVNAFYEAADKDEDGEMQPPLDKAYRAIAYGRVSDYMDLFVARASFPDRAGFAHVEAWWFKCRVCGFILPATRVPSP